MVTATSPLSSVTRWAGCLDPYRMGEGRGIEPGPPEPGTASCRASMRRKGGWSRVTRTWVSGRAVRVVKSSRLISSTGTPARGSVPMTMVMSSPVSSSARETSVM